MKLSNKQRPPADFPTAFTVFLVALSASVRYLIPSFGRGGDDDTRLTPVGKVKMNLEGSQDSALFVQTHPMIKGSGYSAH